MWRPDQTCTLPNAEFRLRPDLVHIAVELARLNLVLVLLSQPFGGGEALA